MKKKILYSFLFLILILACNTDNESDIDCSLVLCAAPLTYTGVSVYFVDKETDENSFVSGSLTLDDITVTDSENNVVKKELKEIELQDPDLPFRSHFLVIHDDFESGENEYSFTIKNNLEFDIAVDARENITGCCLGIYLDDLQIQGTDHTLEHSIHLPIIYIE